MKILSGLAEIHLLDNQLTALSKKQIKLRASESSRGSVGYNFEETSVAGRHILESLLSLFIVIIWSFLLSVHSIIITSRYSLFYYSHTFIATLSLRPPYCNSTIFLPISLLSDSELSPPPSVLSRRDGTFLTRPRQSSAGTYVRTHKTQKLGDIISFAFIWSDFIRVSLVFWPYFSVGCILTRLTEGVLINLLRAF
jgi:hypothetical protein